MEPSQSSLITPLADRLDDFIRWTGRLVSWANAILIGVIILQVVLRYGFGRGLVPLEELQWHLYAIAVMFGMAFAQAENAHVRVDVLHARFSQRTRCWVEILGILVLMLPFLWIVFDHSLDFVYDAWRTGEHSQAPMGLPYRWAIKAVIPLSFGLLMLAALSRLIRNLHQLVRGT